MPERAHSHFDAEHVWKAQVQLSLGPQLKESVLDTSQHDWRLEGNRNRRGLGGKTAS